MLASYIGSQTAVAYTFFDLPVLKMVKLRGEDREALVFTCNLPTCQEKLNVYTTTSNVGSTSNLRRHVERCRGPARLAEADQVGKLSEVRRLLAMHPDGTITSAFKRTGSGTISYSTRSLTETQVRCVKLTWLSACLLTCLAGLNV